MQTNTTPKPTRTNKVQRVERDLYAIAPSEVETWSLRELFPGYSRCLSCDELFSPANPAFNSYISYADGSHNEGICRQCSQSKALGHRPQDDLAHSPFVAPRSWLTLSDAVQRLLQTPIEAFSEFGHRQNRQPRQDLSSTRPGNFSKQTVSQRGSRRDGIVRTNFTVALRAVFTRLSVLSFWVGPC